MPIMWCLANPKIGECEVVAALLEHNHHLVRTGQILLADKGFAGKGFKQLTDATALRLLSPDRKDETFDPARPPARDTHGRRGGKRSSQRLR